jgi:signal transduction histidine kinase
VGTGEHATTSAQPTDGTRPRDIVIAVGLTLLSLLAVAVDSSGVQSFWGIAAAAGLAVGASVALVWRAVHPVGVAGFTLLTGLPLQLLRPELDWPLPALVAVTTLATRRPPRQSLWGLAGLLAVALVGLSSQPVSDVVVAGAIAITSWALGEGTRNRRLRRSEGRLRAVMEERARISREMHDIIAHNVSVIVVQAAAGAAVFDVRPEQSRQALISVEAVGRESLLELRRLLAAPGAQAPDTPTPGLRRLGELVAGVRAAGLEVELREIGSPAELPAPVDLSAYRIVQEALTNTLRHARATRSWVLVTWSATGVELDIRDDGAARFGPHTPGRGLVGMRERAAALGGELAAGPDPAGGFRVHATLPRRAG